VSGFFLPVSPLLHSHTPLFSLYLQYQDIPMPRIQHDTHVVLKVIACGICGSDLHPYHGKEGCATGTAFGHECE
jgi:threonine dehydrogenase-like Zn-dependent dehydrogenase